MSMAAILILGRGMAPPDWVPAEPRQTKTHPIDYRLVDHCLISKINLWGGSGAAERWATPLPTLILRFRVNVRPKI